jgi:hypothetical protein
LLIWRGFLILAAVDALTTVAAYLGNVRFKVVRTLGRFLAVWYSQDRDLLLACPRALGLVETP